MKNIRLISAAKSILFAALAIGICSMVFAVGNEAILARVIGKPLVVAANEEVPPVLAIVAADDLTTKDPDFTSADYKVIDNTNEHELPWYITPPFTYADYKVIDNTNEYKLPWYITPPESALTAQEAADAAAVYLWRTFDYTSKGKRFYMAYNRGTASYNMEYDIEIPSGRAKWDGYVNVFEDDVSEPPEPGTWYLGISFSVDAITGEIVSVSRTLTPLDDQIPCSDSMQKQRWENNRDEYIKIVSEFAEKNGFTQIASAELEAMKAVSPSGVEVKTVDENGNEVPLFDYPIFDILVKDESGRGMVISVTANTKEIEGFIPESWLDPYNRELWEKKLVEGGFK